MSGLGTTAIGSTPFGFGTPAEATAPPERTSGARFIDPRTRDYVLTADGEFARMPVIRQRVMLALFSERGSSTVLRDFGIRIPGKIDQSFESAVRSTVTAMLQPMVTAGELRIDFIRVELPGKTGQVLLTVGYTDLSTLESDVLNF